jgi:hypothetical protein
LTINLRTFLGLCRQINFLKIIEASYVSFSLVTKVFDLFAKKATFKGKTGKKIFI